MGPTTRRILVVLAVAGFARGALHLATFQLPVSNDDAILLLMGQALLRGELATTLWNQPYNGALDAYLLAPLLAVLPHHAAYRVYQALCAALLVWLAFLLARRLGGEDAGWAAALAAAVGAPYMALMTATGPPPNFLMPLVTGFPLVAGMNAAAGAAPGRLRAPRAGDVVSAAEPGTTETRITRSEPAATLPRVPDLLHRDPHTEPLPTWSAFDQATGRFLWTVDLRQTL